MVAAADAVPAVPAVPAADVPMLRSVGEIVPDIANKFKKAEASAFAFLILMIP